MLQLTFNPGLTLTGFRTTRPWTLEFFPPAESWLVDSNIPRSSRMQGDLCKVVMVDYACGFNQSENGEIFWMNNNVIYATRNVKDHEQFMLLDQQPRPQGLLLDDFQSGHFENRRGEGPGDEVASIRDIKNKQNCNWRRPSCAKEKSSGVENVEHVVEHHSRPQRPRSFWSAPRIATSGLVQPRKSAIHELPFTLRMFRVKFDKSDWFWSQSIVFTEPWCWPKGARPLGTRMVERQPTVWLVPNACAQPYHPGSGSHGQLFRPC